MAQTEANVADVARRESFFEKLADRVSFGMGTPRNILFWLMAVVAWILIFAVGGPHIASGTWLPRWFTSTGFNFPLNLVTTIAQLFIGFLVGAAANRTERTNDAQMLVIRTETDEIDALLKENTELIKRVAVQTALLEEIHLHVTNIGKKVGAETGRFPPGAPPR